MGPRLIVDIETNGLMRSVNTLHCIATLDISTLEECLYTGPTLPMGIQSLNNASELIGHNITGYDVPVLRLLRPDFQPTGRMTDTLILGCILYPDDRIMSLEAWAKRLKLQDQKVENEDWSVYTEHMGMRCLSDVRINHKVYEYLLRNEHYGLTRVSLETEQAVSMIHATQAYYGVNFNEADALSLLKELDWRIAALRGELMDIAPWHTLLPTSKIHQQRDRDIRQSHVDKNEIPPGTVMPFRKDGCYSVNTKKYFGDDFKQCKGPYTKIECKPLNPDSSDEVKELLLTLGWVPMEYNYKKDKGGQYIKDSAGQLIQTSPKLTEESYISLPPGLGKKVAEYNTMNHRRNFILNRKDDKKGALAAVKLRGDGRVSADAFTCGTNTGRYRHSGTVCNIPRPTSAWGPQVRALFCVPEGMDMIGADLSGIEARCLAHYLLRGGYTMARETTALILSPDKTNDFHSYNAKQWGVDRDTAKSTLYALMYGAGAKKLAQTAGKPEGMGTKLKRDFYKAHPGIEELIEDLERVWGQKGHIGGLDGRPLYIRSGNKLLNTLLQSAAAVVFKRWMVRVYTDITAKWWRAHQIIAYHDELQFECDPAQSASFAAAVERMSTETGEELKILVPIEAKAKIGGNWKDCH